MTSDMDAFQSPSQDSENSRIQNMRSTWVYLIWVLTDLVVSQGFFDFETPLGWSHTYTHVMNVEQRNDLATCDGYKLEPAGGIRRQV